MTVYCRSGLAFCYSNEKNTPCVYIQSNYNTTPTVPSTTSEGTTTGTTVTTTEGTTTIATTQTTESTTGISYNNYIKQKWQSNKTHIFYYVMRYYEMQINTVKPQSLTIYTFAIF